MIRKESFIAGFSVALGVAGLLLLLFIGWRLLGAVTAMIAPFLIALVLAVLLDPLADRLEQRIPNRLRGHKRLWAVVLVFLFLLLLLAGLLAFIVPNLIAQTSRLITFFAPLSYKIERSRPDGRFIIVEKEATGSSYTIKGLENDHAYTFRVIARDSEGKQYLLKETTATPRARVLQKTLLVMDGKGAKTTKGTDHGASIHETTATDEDDTGDLSTLPTSTPRPTPTPLGGGLFGALSHPASPSPSPTVGDEIDDSTTDTAAASSAGHAPLFGPRPDEQNGDIDNNRYTPGVPLTEPSAAASGGASPAPTVPAVGPPDPSHESGKQANPEPSPAPTALIPLATPSPEPRPVATPVSHVLPARETPVPSPTTTESVDGSQSAQAPRSPRPAIPSPTLASPLPGAIVTETTKPATPTVRLPDPGTVMAVPGDGTVRLLWRPPAEATSGFDRLRTQADLWLLEHHSIGPIRLPPNLASIQGQYSAQLSQVVQQISQRAADIIVGSVSTALTVTLSLIIGFYLLVDFDRLRMRMFHLLPEQARGSVLLTITDVSSVFGNYVRGMATVATFYGLVSIGVFFALGAIFDIGLRPYALLLGVVAGVLYPIPFLGPIMTTVMVTAVALATGGGAFAAVTVALTVQVQNFIFDNVVTPRVVGNSVGLHPLVTIFSLLLGGQLFGLFGMLLAVPVAASIQKLLIRLYPHLGEPTPMVVQNPEHKEKVREGPAPDDPATGQSQEHHRLPVP